MPLHWDMTGGATIMTVNSRDGTRIGVSMTGSGIPLVIVDGAMSSREQHPSAPELDEALAERCTVVRYDRRGRGLSAAGEPGIIHEVDDLCCLVNELAEPPVLLGFSSGAVLALEAVREGLPVAGLALYEPPVVANNGRAPVSPGYPAAVAELVERGDLVGALALFMTEPVGMPVEVVEQMRGDPGFRMGVGAARSLPYDAEIMAPVSTGVPSALSRFDSVRAPTVVLSGSRTEPWLTSAADAVAATITSAQRRIIEGQDHDPSAESIEPEVHRFLDGLSARPVWAG
ncbi:alpha/beta fold hydrolase [Naumannella halotolerans]|uniref:Pimeloyl-ACP methyl ester carboxylesterase n=1 Tax=Naumannella halotolerans TaxID=993414 RepID=A0A4R7JBQ7_9ACTN|nr:alpha/beta hydrolase [Naumannella halotolerans]TDT33879.1 pimeloyl-ACP methyl ester carboxylesterase [Naumannella halotolerans]